jgi:hypothetical protein
MSNLYGTAKSKKLPKNGKKHRIPRYSKMVAVAKMETPVKQSIIKMTKCSFIFSRGLKHPEGCCHI